MSANRLNTTVRTAHAQAIITAAGATGAKLKAYNGTLPSGVGAVTGGNTLLASGSIISLAPAVLSGTAALGGIAASGTLTGGTASVLSGAAALGGIVLSGSIASLAPATLSGAAAFSGISMSGTIAGGDLYTTQPDTASSWSYLQTATLWSLTGRDDWSGAPTYAAPVWFLCDYAAESRRMVNTMGVEFTSRMLVYTSLPDVAQGDMVLIGASALADPVAAGATEVRAVNRWADTFNAEGAEDFRIAT